MIGRRLLALLLALSLCAAALVHAEEMKVEVACSASSAQVGDTLDFILKGTGTAAVGLFVITPDSRTILLEGESVSYTITQPGLHIFVGYGASTTDNSDPSKLLCRALPIMIDATGEALPPQRLSGQLDILGLTDDGWESLFGQTLYLDEHISTVDLALTLEASALPADAQITFTLTSDRDTRTLLSEPVDGQSQWSFPAVEAVADWFRPSGADPIYGLFPVTAEARLSAEGFEDAFYSTTFFVDSYTNEMRYVNRFFQNGQYRTTTEGEKLCKWLDMSTRDPSDRYRSGYLMLEAEYDYHQSFGYGAGNVTVHVGSWILEVGGSMGLSLLLNPLIEGLSNQDLREKFGEKGEDVYPYYVQLSSVYEDYANDLLAELADLTLAQALVEDISDRTTVHQIVIKAVAEGSEDTVVDLLVLQSKPEDAGTQIGLALPGAKRHQPMILEQINLDDYLSNGNVVLTLLDEKGKRTTATMDDLADLLIDRTALDLTIPKSILENYDTDTLLDDVHAAIIQNPRTTRRTLNKLRNLKDSTDEVLIDWPYSVKGTANGNIKGVQYALDVDEIYDSGLYRLLNDAEKSILIKQQNRIEAAFHEIRNRQIERITGVALDGIVLAANWSAYLQQNDAQQDLQLAYFNTICQVEDEYVAMLEGWRDSLKDEKACKEQGIKEPELLSRAIDELITDIRTCRDTMLTSMSDLAEENADLYTSRQFWSNAVDGLLLGIDVAKCFPAVRATVASIAAKGIDEVRSVLASLTQRVGQKLGNASLAGISAVLSSNLANHSGAAAYAKVLNFGKTLVNKVKPYATPMAVGSIIASFITSEYLAYDENVSTLYGLKKSLVLSLHESLESYGQYPTHQKAVDVIEGLRMMKALKVAGEDLVITQTLGELYEDLELNEGSQLMLLWNELRANNGEPLNASQYTSDVILLCQPVRLGTVEELREENDSLEFSSDDRVRNDDTVLGKRIVGIYAKANQDEVTYNGIAVDEWPSAWTGKVTSDPDAAVDNNGQYAWLPSYTEVFDAWKELSGSEIATGSAWMEPCALYSRDGLELFIPWEEYRSYVLAEEEINKIMATYDDSYDFSFWQFIEKEEHQYNQRILMYCVTMKYIDSLAMYDPTITYR